MQPAVVKKASSLFPDANCCKQKLVPKRDFCEPPTPRLLDTRKLANLQSAGSQRPTGVTSTRKTVVNAAETLALFSAVRNVRTMKFVPASVALLLSLAAYSPAENLPIFRFSIDSMDKSVDPGKDFYKFANGGWLKKAEIPPDQVSWSPTTILIERNLKLLKEILENASADKPDRSPIEREIGDFYAAAMDEKHIEELGFQAIAPDLAKIDGLKSKDELPELLADLHEHGVGAFFDASVDADARKSDTYALSFTQGGIGLPDRDYYFDKKFAKERAAYNLHIGKMLALQGKDAKAGAADAKVIVAIETALAKASRKLEDLSDPIANYHKVTLADFQKSTPAFAWDRYLTAVGAPKMESVIIGQPEFFQALQTLLDKTSLDDIKTYLRWHLLVGTAPLLHEAAAQESFAFFGTTLTGQPKLDDRWKRVIRRVDEGLGEALGQIYVERFFPAEAKKRMDEMVNNLKAVYHDRLSKVPWMQESTRKEAVAKFDKFNAKIGAPEKYRDYSGIELKRDDFLGNVQRCDRFESRRQMARVGQAVDRTEWGMTPPTVNAYYNPTMNEIVFPAGILQPPFFDLEMDDAVNYGATGATIGHEMTHGFDNEGRKYDATGNLRDWWTKADVKEFEARTQKLVKQFNAYVPVAGVHVNGKLTLAENIADLGGLSIAFEALERDLAADPSKRKDIDGFTPEQRFFISFAQSWAAKERDQYLHQSLTTDVHSPDFLRGYAPLLDMQEFYDAFNLKKGAPLWRPKEVRAVIW